MKKIAILCCAVALLMQSCSTGSMFNHKRYGHLNWIDHDTKVETEGNGLEPVSESKKVKQEIVSVVEQKVETTVVTNEPTVNTVEEEVVIENSTTPVNSGNEFTIQKKNNDGIENDKIIDQINQTKTEQNIDKVKELTSPKVDSDVLLIICIILCLFIPPLAMYLWDQNTDSWFVIDLILFLCLFLLLIGSYGLIGLLSVVIALLRVLGVI